MILISSQRYIDEGIVAEKMAAEDFEVLVSPTFQYDDQAFRVVLDGHHSLAAAKEAGATPVFVVADSTDHDAIGLLENGEAEDFLSVVHLGDDYYNVETGMDIW